MSARIPLNQSRLHVAVCRSAADKATIVCEATLSAGVDLILGSDSTASLVVPDWTGPSVLLISGDGFLHIGPRMRVNMCGDGGVGRIVGTFEELLASGVAMPLPTMMRRMNIRVRRGMSVFAKYVNERGEPMKSEVNAVNRPPGRPR
jgi:hypothetical protein